MWTPPHPLRDANLTFDAQASRDVRKPQVNEMNSADLCPLQRAIQKELQAVGIGVSEVERFLLCGDLTSAEKILGSVFQQLKERHCAPEPAACEWVREENESRCDLIRSSEPSYLHPVPTKKPSMSGKLEELVDKALRF